MYLYTVNGKPFESFKEAIAKASKTGSHVIEIRTGIVRWSPAPPVSAKRLRMYKERQAAFAAQEAGKRKV